MALTHHYHSAQLEMQRQYRCDYVITTYRKAEAVAARGEPVATTKATTPPLCVPVGKPVTVKLSHQIFLQISLGILKDRLSRYLDEQRKAANDNTNGAAHDRRVVFQADVLALFLFLRLYLNERTAAQAAVTGSSLQSSASTTIRGEHLRFQLLLEYGVDVKKVMAAEVGGSASMPDMQRHMKDHLLPPNITEEEFLVQLSKPSGMAQTCSLM